LRDTPIWATIATSMCIKVKVTWLSFLRLINFINYGLIPAAEFVGDLVKSAVDHPFPYYDGTISPCGNINVILRITYSIYRKQILSHD